METVTVRIKMLLAPGGEEVLIVKLKAVMVIILGSVKFSQADAEAAQLNDAPAGRDWMAPFVKRKP